MEDVKLQFSVHQLLIVTGTRSVIITSGTLSPLASFELEMRTRFPWQLQNPHIVSPAQFFVAVVNSGPLGSKLSSAYSNRSSIDYLNDLGAFIANMRLACKDWTLFFQVRFCWNNEDLGMFKATN